MLPSPYASVHIHELRRLVLRESSPLSQDSDESRAAKLAPLYNTPDSGFPYLPGRRLGRPAAEMNQHLAAQQEDREDEPQPAYPRSRSRNPLHRVTCRNLTGRQAVTQSAAPQPPTFPHVGMGPRGPPVSSTEYRGTCRPGGVVPQSLDTSSTQFPLRAGETQAPKPPAPSAHLLLTVRGVSLAHCVTQHPEKPQTLRRTANHWAEP